MKSFKAWAVGDDFVINASCISDYGWRYAIFQTREGARSNAKKAGKYAKVFKVVVKIPNSHRAGGAI